MSKPNQQHIVSKCLLKQFSKDEASILKDMQILKNEEVLKTKNKLAKKSCYRLLSKDFNKSQKINISRSNIVAPDKNIFCEYGLYSIKPKEHREYFYSKGIIDLRSDDEIKYFLERLFGQCENDFGIFIKDWNNKILDLTSFYDKHNEKILKFVLSNELRSKHLYKKKENNFLINKESAYAKFDYLMFSAFIILNFDKIIEKLDYYEIVEILNDISDFINTDDKSKNELFKKYLASKNIELLSNKYSILVKNDTNLSFLLSDVATSVFYNNSEGYKQTLRIIGADKFDKKPKKIILMPLSKDLLVLVSDTPFNFKSIEINNESIIKKINSLLYSNNNEWLVLYDIISEKKDIVDVGVLSLLIKKENYSNIAKWFLLAKKKESLSNVEYKYNKVGIKAFDNIKRLILCLKKTEYLSSVIKSGDYRTLNFKGDEKYDQKGVIFIKCSAIEKHLIINNESVFKEIFKFNDMQLKCFEKALIIEGYISGIYISKDKSKILFYKNISKKSRIIEMMEKK